MSDKLALRGTVIDVEPDSRDAEIEALHDEIRRLRADLSIANRDTARAREETQRALSALRKQLNPLYSALQAVYGELDAAGIDDSASQVVEQPRVSAGWESGKQRLGGQTAKVIDALLLHGEMNTTQIAIAIGTRRQNIPNLIFKLNQAGLINKNGGRFSLKQI